MKNMSLVDGALGLLKNDYRAQLEFPFSLDDGTKVANFVSGLFKIEAELNGVKSDSFSQDQLLKDFSLDDDSFFTSRALENIDATIRFWKYTDLPFLTNVPFKNDIPVGVSRHTWQYYDFTGSYKRSQANNTDLPTAQVKGLEDNIVIHPGSGAIGWNRMELDSAQFANAPLEATKAKALFRAYSENIHNLMIDPTVGADINPLLKGWMRSDIGEYAVPATGTASSTYWADKTGRLIADDLNFARQKISTGTRGRYGIVQPAKYGLDNGVSANLTLAVTLAAFDILSQKYMYSEAGVSTQTVLDYIQSPEGMNRLGINQIIVVPQLEGKFNSGTEDGFILYVNDSDVLQFAKPLDLTPLPVQFNGLNMSIPYYDYYGGMILYLKSAAVRFNAIIDVS